MFESARLKLTAWYVLIIILVSVIFSFVIFAGINNELTRFERYQQLRFEYGEEGIPVPPIPRRTVYFDSEIIAESRNRIIFVLVLINFGILVIAGGAAYFLAGRTLQPIKEMVDEQNRFITDASHEFRTPLTSLRSEIEVSLRDKKLRIEEAKNLIQSNLEEVINLQTLSDSLMNLASYQKRNSSVPSEKFFLSEIIQAAVKKIIPIANKKNISVKNEIKNYSLRGYPQRLTELFVILLDNAIKYSPEKTSVFLTSRKTDHTILINVRDEGIGIAKKDLPHIFNRFFRADISRSKSKALGFGLGLSIAKKIAELHHGIIEVTSVVKKGTTFTVRLPIG